MTPRSNKFWIGLLLGAAVALALGAGIAAVLRVDVWGERSSRPPARETLGVDPSLLQYEQTAAIRVELKEPRALAVGPDDRICVGGDKAVLVLDRDGIVLQRIALEAAPQCLAIAGSDHAAPGRMYVGMEDHVEVYDARGNREARWKPVGGEPALTSIVAAEQDVFAADAGNRIVWRYDLNGKLLRRIGRPDAAKNYPGLLVASPMLDIVLGGDGLLYVVNPVATRVEAFTFDGDLESSWGHGSNDIDGFFGCCNPAQLALMPDGRFVTLEKGVRRIKIYSPRGEFQCLVAGVEQLGEHPGDLATDSRGRILVLDPLVGGLRVFEQSDKVEGTRRVPSAENGTRRVPTTLEDKP